MNTNGLFPQYDDLLPMTYYQFQVDFNWYRDNNFITPEQCEDLTNKNNQAIAAANK